MEVLQECDSTTDVKQMTKSTAQPQQQSQSLPVKLELLGPRHAGDEPDSECPAVAESSGEAGNVEQAGTVPLDEEPLDETQPVVLPVLQPPREDRLSRAIRLELERLQFEKEARRRFKRARAVSPNRAPRRGRCQCSVCSSDRRRFSNLRCLCSNRASERACSASTSRLPLRTLTTKRCCQFL